MLLASLPPCLCCMHGLDGNEGLVPGRWSVEQGAWLAEEEEERREQEGKKEEEEEEKQQQEETNTSTTDAI